MFRAGVSNRNTAAGTQGNAPQAKAGKRQGGGIYSAPRSRPLHLLWTAFGAGPFFLNLVLVVAPKFQWVDFLW